MLVDTESTEQNVSPGWIESIFREKVKLTSLQLDVGRIYNDVNSSAFLNEELFHVEEA